MSATAVRELVRKEFRQLMRSKRAVATAVLMPGFLLLYFPIMQGTIMAPRPSATSSVDVDVTPPSVSAQPGGPPVSFCAHVTVVGNNDPVPGVMVRFSPAADSTPTSDASGMACASIPVPGQLGDFPVSAFPVNRPLHRLGSIGRLVVGVPSAYVPPTPTPTATPGFLSNLGDPRRLFQVFLFPFFLVLASALAPMSFALQTSSAERDRGTLSLLTALPVRVTEILAAKVVSTLAVGAAVIFPFFLVDLLVVGMDRLGGPGLVVLDLLLLCTGMAASGGLTLLVTLLVKDIRTSGQLVGFLTLPAVLVFAAVLILVPTPLNVGVAAALLLAVAVLSLLVAQRWVTFERYLE